MNEFEIKDCTYDPEADAVYIPLGPEPGAGEVTSNITIDDPRIHGYVVLDLDAAGVVRGIEVIGASEVLPKAFRASFTN